MRKVILGLAVSLDGYIEGPGGEYDWCFTDQDYGMSSFMQRIDAIFYGRKSYEMMVKASAEIQQTTPWSWDEKKAYVFSKTLKQAPPGAELITGDVVEQVSDIKRAKGKDIWLFGGASLTHSLLTEGLVDEIGMAVHPILLGKGKKLFSELDYRIKLQLVDSKTYDTGLVYLTYNVLH